MEATRRNDQRTGRTLKKKRKKKGRKGTSLIVLADPSEFVWLFAVPSDLLVTGATRTSVSTHTCGRCRRKLITKLTKLIFFFSFFEVLSSAAECHTDKRNVLT